MILENEYSNELYKKFTKGTWDDRDFELATCETGTSNKLVKGLKHCSSKPHVKNAVLYLPLVKCSEEDIIRVLCRYKGLITKSKMPLKLFERIICIAEDKILLEISL